MGQMARALIAIGALLLLAGVFLLLLERLPGWRPGRLPGDLTFHRRGWRVDIPLGTSLLVSLILSAIVTLVFWIFRR